MSQTRFSVLIHQQAKKYGDRVALNIVIIRPIHGSLLRGTSSRIQ